MTYRPYPRYKPSGIAWLDTLPEGWGSKNVVNLRADSRPDSFCDGDWIESPYITDEGIRLIQTGNIGVGRYREQGFRYISESTFGLLRCTEVKPGDILICRLGDPVSRSCIAPDLGVKMITSVDVCILRVPDACLSRYLNYVFNCSPYLDYVASLVRGSTRDRISRKMLGRFAVPVPAADSLEPVVSFLDRETAKIDALIVKQEQLIAALREDRTATITNAVTKGLDPGAEMKDSGVEWLGNVPAHWDVDRIKRSIASARNGVWGAEPDGGEDDIRCVRVADFDRPLLRIHDNDVTLRQVSPTERRGRTLQKGDLLLEKSGGGEKNPVGFVVLYDRDEPAVCSNFIARVELAEGEVAQFWTYVHHCLYASRLTYPSIKQNTGIQNLDQDSYFNERAGFPPPREQADIAAYLDDRCGKIDALMAKAEQVIRTLREYRSALITNAVTGKIDVRGAA